jgi:hypothetical protein
MTQRANLDAARLAARNNADWCDAICRAHGAGGRFEPALWQAAHATPPYYPNVVTLEPTSAAVQVEAIARLRQVLPDGFAVKDSFAALDLAPLGFAPLFSATWIRRPPGPAAAPPDPGLVWRIVTTPAEFAQWRAAWGDEAGVIFPPPLQFAPGVTLIGGWRGETVVAGAALNRSEEALGWSNVFGPEEASCRAIALAFAAEIAGPLPLVGYEGGDALEQSIALGFKAVGPLTIWAC